MSTLLVKYEPETEGAADKVSTRVRRVADAKGNAVHDPEIDFRLGNGGDRLLEVEPGHYLVEASWRNGRLTTQPCFIERGGTGTVQLKTAVQKRTPKPADRDFSRVSAGGMSRRSSRKDASAYSLISSDPDFSTWDFVCSRDLIESRSTLSSEHRPLRRAADVKLEHRAGAPRTWVMYWADACWTVSSLPFDVGNAHEVAVLRSDPEELPFVSVCDPDAGVMTDLLPSGNSEVAQRYAASTSADISEDELEAMIKTRPLELCAFAYAEYENFGPNRWIEAIKRMKSHESWLSDVPAILGWRLLMQASSEEELDTAADLLERAVSVGVPYYSLGVRLLAEGLTLLAGMRNRHAGSAGLVGAVAARTVPSEAFTAVRL